MVLCNVFSSFYQAFYVTLKFNYEIRYKKITGKDLDLSSPSEGGAGYADRG